MKIAALIAKIRRRKPNAFVDQDILDWLNEVEQRVFSELCVEPVPEEISVVSGTNAYELSTGKKPEDVIDLSVNNIPYEKVATNVNQDKYGKRAYSLKYDDGTITATIYPVPGDTDVAAGLKIVVNSKKRATEFVLADVNTQETRLPDEHEQVYQYYVYAMIDKENRQSASYMTNMDFFNNAWGEAAKSLQENKAKKPAEEYRFKNIW